MAQPLRKPLQDFHEEFLAHPANHGVEVKSFKCDDGTPCLVVTPTPDGSSGPRGQKLRAQLVEHGYPAMAPGAVAGTLVLLHGRNGRKEDYLLIAERFCAAGFRCVIPDLPGHGEHPGKFAGYGQREAALPEQVLHQAADRYAFDPRPAGLMGISMGGAVALQAAARPGAEWRALIVVSTFDRLANVVKSQAASHLGSWLGAPWAWGASKVFEQRTGIAMADVQSLEAAASLRIPVLVAHGSADRIIPMALGKALFEALTARHKEWIEIPGADHHNVLITEFPIYATMAEWMLRWVPVASQGQ